MKKFWSDESERSYKTFYFGNPSTFENFDTYGQDLNLMPFLYCNILFYEYLPKFASFFLN